METIDRQAVVSDAGPLIHLDELDCLYPARLAAKALEYRAHGTVGILLRAIRRGQRSKDQILALLREIPLRSTLHIRPGLLRDIIEEVKQSPD